METYKRVIKHPKYEVSNLGNVRNTFTGKQLTQYDKDGYKQVKLNNFVYYVHRLVAIAFIPNPQNKPLVDHINNNPSDNNVTNLRWCTATENQRNRKIGKANKTGCKGVYYEHNKWRVRITDDNGKKLHLGYFDSYDKAVEVRKQKALELYGEFINDCEKPCEKPTNKDINININVNINLKLNVEPVMKQ